jgi:hypothetical protein
MTPGNYNPLPEALTAELPLLRWRGHTRAGTAVGGCTYDRPAVLAERFYRRGYRDVEITDDSGVIVAGVGPNNRLWWADK